MPLNHFSMSTYWATSETKILLKWKNNFIFYKDINSFLLKQNKTKNPVGVQDTCTVPQMFAWTATPTPPCFCFWIINIWGDWNNFLSPKLYLYRERLPYPLHYSDTNPDGQIQKAKWAKALRDLLGERPLWMIFPIWCLSLWNKLLFDILILQCKSVKCTPATWDFPFDIRLCVTPL